MPDYEVLLRYSLQWTASKIVKAQNEEAAQAKVEKDFAKVVDYSTFEKFVSDDSTPQIDEENLEVEEVNEL